MKKALLWLAFLLASSPLSAQSAKVGGPVSPDGTVELACDLPTALHLKNVGGSDGAGLCVFTSLDHSGRWQNEPAIVGFRDWMRKHPGGGYPAKVDKMIDQMCKEKGLPKPQYIQVEGSDLEILKVACRSGRMPGVTYAFSPTGRYRGTIAHMVSLVHLDDKWACVLDNNFPGTYEWMPVDTFRRVYTGNGGGWAVIFLAPTPPFPPHN